MFGRSIAGPALVLSLLGKFALATPVWAEVPFRWAEVRSAVNQVDLQSADGSRRRAVLASCLCPGETLSTSGVSQAELRLSDGSLLRVGEQAHLQVRHGTRALRLSQGTTLIFTPPNQGRTTLETPNAMAGLDQAAVVVRYVPTRDLTLVMALATSETGPVSVTPKVDGREGVLYAGQMALVSAQGVQIIEFDLLEFYRTSRLIRGLGIPGLGGDGFADEGFTAVPSHDPVALLRPLLLSAMAQQAPFDPDTILDPRLISPPPATPSPLAVGPGYGWPFSLDPADTSAQPAITLPAGVVTPLPDPAAPVEDIPDPTPSDPTAPPSTP